MEEKSKNSNFGESSREGLSLFQAFAMEKEWRWRRSKLEGNFLEKVMEFINLGEN